MSISQISSCRRRFGLIHLRFPAGLLMLALILGLHSPARGLTNYALIEADSSLALRGNTVIEMAYDGQYLWLVTGKGLLRTTPDGPDGEESINYDDTLIRREVSAVAVGHGEVWVASTSSAILDKKYVPQGQGFNLSYDQGDSWEEYRPEQARGNFNICYDLALMDSDSSIWAACWAGGLIHSSDHGETWKNMFQSAQSEEQYNLSKEGKANSYFNNLNNLFFSVLVDETEAGSRSIWAGSAAGIKRFIFLDPEYKLTGTFGSDWGQTGDTVWLATESGLAYSANFGAAWRSVGVEQGLPTPYVASFHADANGYWAGSGADFDTTIWASSTGAGIVFAPRDSDPDDDWQLIESTIAVGAGGTARDFATVNGNTYAACGDSGLIVYLPDSAKFVRPLLPENASASAYLTITTQLIAEEGATDTSTILWAGTENDLYAFHFGPESLFPDSLLKYNIEEDTTDLSNLIVGVAIQRLSSGAEVLWTLHHAAGGNNDGFAFSEDGGANWETEDQAVRPYAIGFAGSTAYLAMAEGLARNVPGEPVTEDPWFTNLDTLMVGGENKTDVRSIHTPDDTTIWVGTTVGFARSLDAGFSWHKMTGHPDSNIPDDTLHFRVCIGDTTCPPSISGQFVTALALQEHAGSKALWAATQVARAGGRNGISVSYNTDRHDSTTWAVVADDVRAYHFAFSGSRTYAATAEGLLIFEDDGNGAFLDRTITTFVDTLDLSLDGGEQYYQEFKIVEHTEFYSVAAVGNIVWVGTENGLAISFDGAENWDIVRYYQSVGGENSPEPYVTPVPWSPENNITPGGLSFHYVPPVDGPVIITIYDFSNRKVIEISDGFPRRQGQQYDESDKWDGKNENGDVVAVGTYFFIIEYGDGSSQWGKLVVLP